MTNKSENNWLLAFDHNDDDDNVDEDDICYITVRSGHAIAFTNELFHAGG